jgi:hypothetical protein
VAIARDMALEADRDALADAQKQREEARAQLEKSETESVNRAAASAQVTRPTKSESLPLALEAAAAEMRLQEIRSTAGYRAERLKIFDPGMVPERPSWPNIPLILIAAVLVALVASLLYLTFEFNYRLEKSAAPRAVAPLARIKNLND